MKRILELRGRRGWGARKLARVVETEFGHCPSNDTVHRILRRHGLVATRKPERRRTQPGLPGTSMDRPNMVWTADVKRQFRTLDGALRYQLTIQDVYSPFILEIYGLERLSSQATRRRFTRV